jgi:hypothetical protein
MEGRKREEKLAEERDDFSWWAWTSDGIGAAGKKRKEQISGGEECKG